MGSKASSSTKKLRPGARLTDDQDAAVEQAAQKLTESRGTKVCKSDVYREALHKFCQPLGVKWPVG